MSASGFQIVDHRINVPAIAVDQRANFGPFGFFPYGPFPFNGFNQQNVNGNQNQQAA